VRLTRVSARYGSSRILHNVSAAAPLGSLIGLCGPNGSGKTTLLRMMLGLAQPEQGEVRVLGFEPWRCPQVRRHIGYLPQVRRLDAGFPLSVRDLVSMGTIRGLGALSSLDHLGAGVRTETRRQVDHALDMAELGHLAGRPVGELSGGQLQLALLARALVGSPKLLLLDEPLAGMDGDRKASFYPLLARWRELCGGTAIVVCHELQALTAHVDFLWCLDSGSLHCHQLRQPSGAQYDRDLQASCLIEGVMAASRSG